ncbi:MAG: hypothetical protein AAGC64_09545 [Bacteroidota bacterium]
MEKNKEILKESIDGLRQSEGPNIWSLIARELDSQEEQNKDTLARSIEFLPEYEAPNVWLGVSSKLKAKSANRWKYLAMAASVSLVAVFSYLFLSNQPSEKLSYSTEQVEFFEGGQQVSIISDDAEDLLLGYIKENCTRLAATCQDPEFKELLEVYIELDETKKELNQALEKSIDQAQVMKYLIKVEKHQTRIGKDMLKKMKSI